MKRLLLTGSAGFVGSHLVEHLLNNTEYEIIGIDGLTKYKGDSLRIIRDPKYQVFYHDLNAPLSHRLINKIGKVDFIINMASDSHVDRSIDFPVDNITNNVNLVLNMLEYARIAKPEVFIQISTDEVYGPAPVGINHKEWSTILPSNAYSASKACQEAICISYWRMYGVPVVLTNTMNMIGERQDPEKFLPMLIKRINNGELVQIHGNNDFIGSRYYLHARNHADALWFLIDCVQDEALPDFYYKDTDGISMPPRYNIVGEAEMNNLQVAEFVADRMGKDLKYELVDFHKARPGHDRRYALDGDKIAKLGWKAPVPLLKSIDKTIKWTLDHPEWLL